MRTRKNYRTEIIGICTMIIGVVIFVMDGYLIRFNNEGIIIIDGNVQKTLLFCGVGILGLFSIIVAVKMLIESKRKSIMLLFASIALLVLFIITNNIVHSIPEFIRESYVEVNNVGDIRIWGRLNKGNYIDVEIDGTITTIECTALESTELALFRQAEGNNEDKPIILLYFEYNIFTSKDGELIRIEYEDR